MRLIDNKLKLHCNLFWFKNTHEFHVYRMLTFINCHLLYYQNIKVCKCRRGVYMYVRALRYGAETWHGGRGRAHKVGEHIKQPNQMSKVIHMSSCFENTLWPPKLVGRTPDQRVMHRWGQRSCRVKPGQPVVRNALWLLNLVGRIPDSKVMQWSKVMWGQPEVTLLRNDLQKFSKCG